MTDISKCAYCVLTKTSQDKKEGTKTVWINTEVETHVISREYYRNIVESVDWFRRLGGSETVQKSYTREGYIPVRIISTRPDKERRSIYEFDFEHRGLIMLKNLEYDGQLSVRESAIVEDLRTIEKFSAPDGYEVYTYTDASGASFSGGRTPSGLKITG